jgi:hypothetical protein
MTTIIAIDPGPTESAFVHYDEGRLIHFGKVPNDEMLAITGERYADQLVIEQVASFGMAVGEEVFETVFWSGRFAQMWASTYGRDVHRVKRHAVKMAMCGNTRAKDGNIRQAIIDRYGGVEGKAKAIGTKREPGPLYGVSADVWQALALAITFDEKVLHNAA